MFYKSEKLQNRIEELNLLRYEVYEEIVEFKILYENNDYDRFKIIPKISSKEKFKLGDCWSGRGNYLWIQAEIHLPEAIEGKKIVGIFDFGKTGEGFNSGFESLIFVNAIPFQGVDSNHKEVVFPDEYAGSKVEITFRLWAGLEGGGEKTIQTHQFLEAEIAYLDGFVDDLYYTSKAVHDTTQVLSDDNYIKNELLSYLDYSFLELDWRNVGRIQFIDSVKQSLFLLKENLKKISFETNTTVYTVGHTHIDVAWLWQLKHTREKVARSFSTILKLMDDFPEFTFLQTQPQLYEYLKKDYPQIYEKIKNKISNGQWEANGGMWLEADCNIVSGESLVRQLLMGKKFLLDEFNVDSNVLWLPDVFGYSWALPQILSKSGIDVFMTIKISWNQYNEMPHDTFWWKGIDGTKILTHFITTPSISDGGNYTYNGEISPRSIKGSWDLYHDKELNSDLLLSYGFGNGGGGVNREMLEAGRRLSDMPGLPKVRPTTAFDYFEKLKENIGNTSEYVHTWDGELYLEYHRGTYTSQAWIKKANRKLELKLKECEWLSILVVAKHRDWKHYKQSVLCEIWKILLRNQFHDIIPGSSISEVYEDAKSEFKRAFILINDLEKEMIGELGTYKTNVYSLINSTGYTRTELITLNKEDSGGCGEWLDDDGMVLDVVEDKDKWYVRVNDIPKYGSKSIKFIPANSLVNHEFASTLKNKNEIETDYYKIKWNKFGQLTSIFDKKNHREIILKGEVGNLLRVYEDKPLKFDAWDIDIFYKEKYYDVTELEKCTVRETSLFIEIEMNWAYLNSTIHQTIFLEKNGSRIDFNTKVNWNEHQQLLRVLFYVDIRSIEATYDIQYGNVKRPTHYNTSWEQAKFETIGHQWVDFSENNYGISLLNDCKYGYSVHDNVIGLSLIKSGIYPDLNADQGLHTFIYSLISHKGSWQNSNIVKEAECLNVPLLIEKNCEYENDSFFDLKGECVAIDAIKKSESDNSIIVRVHEYGGNRTNCSLQIKKENILWYEINLMEEKLSKVFRGDVEFKLHPYEIKTFLIKYF